MRINGYFESLTYLVNLNDPRADRGDNHLLIDMVGLVLGSTICGADTWADTWADIERFCKAHQAWFEEFLELPEGIASHDAFGRVFSLLDTEQLQQCLAAWVEHLQFCLERQTVAIDGKTLRGAHDKSTGRKSLHVVNVWANQLEFCLGQISVSEKSNEIPAVQELLGIFNLKVAVVTADAPHCQNKTVKNH